MRQPEGNGVAERVIKTLKEQLLWVRYFPTIEALRKGLAEFADLYKASWLSERDEHNQVKPKQEALVSQVATAFKLVA